ncbi:Pyruvate, phosphate dikinase 2 [Nymphon striatum]|nr:Pyruvate, phosphate dikinase 2 [Nymphon striatum]
MRQHVQAEIDAFTGVLTSDNHSSEITIGTMIETPRAALTAGQIAAQADFFSFGTNDLTQLTWGFSRDDVEARVISRYKELGLLDANPFERLDQAGVGSLVASAITDARRVNPDLEIGVCGEHGGDPSSIAFFVEGGCELRVMQPVPSTRGATCARTSDWGI